MFFCKRKIFKGILILFHMNEGYSFVDLGRERYGLILYEGGKQVPTSLVVGFSVTRDIRDVKFIDCARDLGVKARFSMKNARQ